MYEGRQLLFNLFEANSNWNLGKRFLYAILKLCILFYYPYENAIPQREVGIYKRKHDFDQESDQIKKEKNRITVKKKERKHAQESKIQEKAITIKKKEGNGKRQ